jgi:hypothetical protein
MPDDTEAAALHAWLETIIKEAEDVEAQAARLLPAEEESNTTTLEQTAIAARQHMPSLPSSVSSPATAPPLVPTTSSTYEDTVITGLHLQPTTVLNVR